MKIHHARLSALALGTLWALASGLPALADDTELFIATSSGAGIKPNILFVIDNSGSMATNVITQENYDPSVTYTGACDASRVYWRTGTGAAPATIRERFTQIRDEDLRLLGYDPNTARPEGFILQVLPVPPVTVRPSIILETGIRSEDDLTHKMVDIIRVNQRLKESKDAGTPTTNRSGPS